MESVEFRVPGNQLQKFENLFYTKDEWAHLEEKESGDKKGFLGKLKSKAAGAQIDKIKDEAFLEKLRNRLAASGLQETKFGGFLKMIDENTASVEMGVRFRSPSFLFRLFFDDYSHTIVKIECQQINEETVFKIEHPIPKKFQALGCLITVILFGLLILPGVAWYFMMKSMKNAYETICEDLEPVLKETITS